MHDSKFQNMFIVLIFHFISNTNYPHSQSYGSSTTRTILELQN